MALENVSIWDEKHGWQRTTPQIAKTFYPYGASASEQIFLCESCGQFASFVVGEYIPHFKHPVGSKECRDKIIAGITYENTNLLGFSLPLRIELSNNDIDVSIGFLPFTQLQLNCAEQKGCKLIILNDNGSQIRELLISGDRFSTERTTFISIGNTICQQYHLKYELDDPATRRLLPRVILGFALEGTLFDSETGKRLPNNADVVVGRAYYLVRKQSYLPHCPDVECEYCRPLNKTWHLFRLSAKALTKSAMLFFLDLSARLTDEPSYMLPIWPPSIQSSNVLIHDAQRVFLYNRGGGTLEVWPSTQIRGISPNGAQGSISSINTASTPQQFLSVSRFAGRTSVLRYIVAERKPLFTQVKGGHRFCIQDAAGKPWEAKAHNALPKERYLMVATEYDGFVEIKKMGHLIERIIMSAGIFRKVAVAWNTTISIFQGRDRCCDVSFVKNSVLGVDDEKAVLSKLKSLNGSLIPLPHGFGQLASRLRAYPQICKWLLYRIRCACIDKSALNLLKSLVTRR